jgi:hypothetical protein
MTIKIDEELKLIDERLNEIQKVNSKGFVAYREILDEVLYPNLNAKMKKNLGVNKEGLEIKDLNDLTDNSLISLIKWSYNEILLEEYLRLLSTIANKEIGVEIGEDVVLDKEILMKEIISKLDPSIRILLEKKGVTITRNSYVGYDSEYQQINDKENKLLSVQMALSGKIVLKLPEKKSYVVSKLGVLDGKRYELHKEKCISYSNIESNVNSLIDRIREIKFKKNDAGIKILIDGLISRGIPYARKDDFIHFVFDRTPIQQWFHKVGEDGYTLQGLMNKSGEIMDPLLDEEHEKVLDILRNIFKEWKEKDFKIEEIGGDVGESEVDADDLYKKITNPMDLKTEERVLVPKIMDLKTNVIDGKMMKYKRT